MAGIENEVTQFLVKAAALSDADKFDEIMELYDENATYVSIGMPPVVGKKDILEKVYKDDSLAELKGTSPTFAAKNTQEVSGLILQVGTYAYGPISGNYSLTLKRVGNGLKYLSETYAVELPE